MIKYCCQLALTAILILIPACSHTLPITERPCKQNITVLNDKNTGNISIISGTVTLIEKDEDDNPSLSIYFQKSYDKYLLSFIYSSFRDTIRPDKAILEFADNTVIQLENPVYNKEMNESASSKYTDTFFEISKTDLKTIGEKLIKRTGITFPIADQTHPLLTLLDVEKATIIKYLANCFVGTIFEAYKK